MKKVALITGASRGIGFSIAKSIQTEFESLILVAKHKDVLDKAATQISSYSVLKYVVDLENENEVLQFAKEINKKFFSLDLLVNNAGVYLGKTFMKQSLADILRMLNLNLKSYILLTHELIPALKNAKDSQVINISSWATHTNIYGEAVYSATKAAVSSFSDVLRKELNSENIRITTIQPAGVDTYAKPNPNLLNPTEIGEIVKYIINRPIDTQIDLVELSNIRQWRGTKPSWIE